jgi:hypothetical protein
MAKPRMSQSARGRAIFLAMRESLHSSSAGTQNSPHIAPVTDLGWRDRLRNAGTQPEIIDLG